MDSTPADRPGPLDLGGRWLAVEAAGDLAKVFAEPGFDDAGWEPTSIPSHWRSHPAFAASDGPLLYRRRFDDRGTAPGQRRFLELDGLFYLGDVWLDGAYLGATEGYFAPHCFEVTEALREAGEHVVAVEVACPPVRDRTAKRTITGVFSHWDNLDPSWNPGGIWRPVRIVETGPVRILRRSVVCTEAGTAHGRLLVDLSLDAPEPAEAHIVVRVTAPDGSLLTEATRDVSLAAGENHLPVPVDVDSPPRWWPWRLGEQPLCRVEVTVELDGERSDGFTLDTAFREIRLDHWTFVVNGERMFTMGSNHGPTRMALAEATPEELARDVALAVDANLDLLRIHAHVTRPELYAAADRAGLLLWQDFPLQWGYARGVRKQAVRQARVMVDLLGHHPSVALWCAHNEPLAVDFQPGEPLRAPLVARVGVSMALPSWNKDVLDRSVARAISKADPSRPVNRHSGILPGPASRGTDTHLYFGWYHGDIDGLAPALRAFPRLARYVTEFGAQAVPETAGWMEPERWPDLDWDDLFEHHALQRRHFERWVPPERYGSFDEWKDATQEYQAALVQLQVEDLRRIRFSPTGGFCQFCFADGHPAVTWSVLDHERVPKRGYAALRDACRPVLGMLEPREGLVHVVNETRHALAGAVVTVEVDGHERRFTGDVPADAIGYVGRVDVAGVYQARVVVEAPGAEPVVNTYPAELFARLRT